MVDESSLSGAHPVTADPDLEQAQESFRQFYVEHRSLAIVMLRVALGGADIEPDDIASQMWGKIWQTWRERGPIIEAPKAYVRQCARNAAIDALRAQPELLVGPDQLDSLAGLRQTVDARSESCPKRPIVSNPGQDTPQGLLVDPRLVAAIQELSLLERLVILVWVETYPSPTSEQIARILKIGSASTVRVHRMRALKKLRDIFSMPDDAKDGE